MVDGPNTITELITTRMLTAGSSKTVVNSVYLQIIIIYDNMVLCDTTRKLSSILNENTTFDPILSKITVYRGQLGTAFLLSKCLILLFCLVSFIYL